MASFVPVRAFYCFDPTDRALCESLDRHLATLKHAGRLQTWDERHILAGQEWEQEYDQQFSTARLLILLVSSDFLASEPGRQHLQMAVDRQRAGEATVVPILVRPCAWEQTALSTVRMLPRDHRALTQQVNRDATWTEIVQEISRVLASLHRQVYLIVAPEDLSKAAQLSEELARIGVTCWYLKDDHLSVDLHVEREAMLQASSVLLVTSPTAFSSRIVRAQKELAEVYQRLIEVVWAREEDGEWETADIWQAENRVGARAGSDEAAKAPLLTRLKEQFETVTPTEQPPPQIAEPRNPYKGLRNFTAEDTRDFFGREALIDELATTVEHLLVQEQKGQPARRLLAVLGASGSGKSSVVLAGLLPRLKREDLSGSGQWLYLYSMVPGTHPLEALAVSLAQQPSLGNASSLHHELTADSLRTLHLLTRQLVGSSSQRVVLFIDQFEEVFTATVSEEERQHFFDLLITAATEPEGPLLVMVTMRADFLDRAMRYPDLYRLLDAHHVTVLPMGRDDLRRVIEEPARLPEVQMTFEGDLVGDLLFELRGQVGALPLLEFTLDQLFAARSGQMFTRSAYREMGGVKGALARRAQTTYDTLPTKEHQKLARSLFLRLIDPGQSEQDTTRRRARLSEFELPDPAQTRLLRETMDVFLDARLLTSNEQAGVATVEVSHEALIREWSSLIAWLHEARQDILLQQKMSEEAEEWQRRRHPNDRLYRGSQLKEAQAWAKRNPPSGNEVAFLQASAARHMRSRAGIIGIILLVLLLSIPAGILVRSSVLSNVVTTFNDDGPGSLRQVIAAAKSGDTITFGTSLLGKVIKLTSNDLAINKNLNIYGPGASMLEISTGHTDYRIHVLKGVSVIISGLAFKESILENPKSLGSTLDAGIILNEGMLTLKDSIISQNYVLGAGGGITNHGTLTLKDSTISNNKAVGNDVYSGGGGGIYNDGILTLISSTVSDNRGSIGGGIYNCYLLISSGGCPQGKVILINSTISGNTASDGGGGIRNEGIMSLTNSTISGNTALDGNGGGIENIGSTVTLTFSTLYRNHARTGGGLSTEKDDISQKSGTSIMLNSLVAGNQASQSPDIAGNLITEGYNLIQNTKGSVILNPNHKHLPDFINTPASQIKVASDLQLNGSTTTKTDALLPGSLAIDVIPPAACLITANGMTITTDQRGIKRPQGSACDIGAYEYLS